jgi:nucleoside-diphosphate-sugar epimerase
MNVLLTGGCGGIGSALLPKLINLGYNVIVVDNLRNGYFENISNINKKSFKFFNLNILNSSKITKLVSKYKIDTIIHLAAITSLYDCELNKDECIEINVLGTQKLLEIARTNNIQNFIFASTSAVYENSDITNIPYTENTIINPHLFYSISKKMCEDLILSYNANYKTNYKILRFFNVISSNQDIFRKNPPILNYLVKSIITNSTPILHSDGNQKRDYILVDDVISFINILINSNTNETIFNLCSGHLLSINDLINLINEEFNIKLAPKFRDSKFLWGIDNPLFKTPNPISEQVIIKETNKLSCGNNSLAKSLNWNPEIDIKTSIKKIARDAFNNYKNKL